MKQLRGLKQTRENYRKLATIRSDGFNVLSPEGPNNGARLRGLHALNRRRVLRNDTLHNNTRHPNPLKGSTAWGEINYVKSTGATPQKGCACVLARAMDPLRGPNKTYLTPQPRAPTDRIRIRGPPASELSARGHSYRSKTRGATVPAPATPRRLKDKFKTETR